MAMSPMMQEYLQDQRNNIKTAFYFTVLEIFMRCFLMMPLLVSPKSWRLPLPEKTADMEETGTHVWCPLSCCGRTYFNRLIEQGHKVAICEQVEDPKLAKGLVKREVVSDRNARNQYWMLQALDEIKEQLPDVLLCLSGR